MSGLSLSAEAPQAQCHSCQLVVTMAAADAEAVLGCPRCGAKIHRRKPDSIMRTWAYLIAAAICYVPANLYPILTVTSLGNVQSDTILSGAVYLLLNGLWPLAFVVFVASVVVPLMKLIALSGLALSVQRRSQWRPKERAQTTG